ncbi:MAG: pitrilysin family protein [Bacteroidota bacterium]
MKKKKSSYKAFPVLDHKLIQLPNGLQVIYKAVPYTQTVHCGYVINAGGRDDTEQHMGLAHFIEHMVFKGTHKRKTYHILNYLESVGGELNAYTGKEKTCFYASLPATYLERGMELLTDITFHSIFPEKEIGKEQQVVAEEIDMYRGVPDEAIFEDFDQQVFPGHGLGFPILGSKTSIQQFKRPQLQQYLQQHYTQGQVIFTIIGNVNPTKVERLVEKYLAPQVLPESNLSRFSPPTFSATQKEASTPGGQAHEIIGGRAPALRTPHYLPFLLLNNLLGGPSMNSRLNLNIRERHGLTYNIHSFQTSYLDDGIWGVYYACDERNLKRIRRMVEKELLSLCNRPLGSLRLHQVKKQLIGQFTMSHENLLGQAIALAKDLLDFDEIHNFEQQVAGIEAVTAAEIMEAANIFCHPHNQSRCTYSPTEAGEG